MSTNEKRVTMIVTLSSNPAVPGDYFVDVRDTTNGGNRQMTTRTLDLRGVGQFIADMERAAVGFGVTVTVDDQTGEVK